MNKYTYTYKPAPLSKAKEVAIVVATILVFASWGVMLAFYG
jgi:hypothetical protein